MKKSFALIALVFLSIVSPAQDADSLLMEAKNAFSSRDFQKAQEKYAELDAIDGFKLSYYDLFRYWLSSEVNHDENNCKSLLFRVVQSNAFEPNDIANPGQSYVEYFKIDQREYWPQIDSVTNMIKSSRCQAFIDSLKIMSKLDQDIRNEEDTDDKYKRMMAIDSANTTKLKLLIAEFGFPTWKLVGREGAENAWFIAQHSATDLLPVFLKQMEKAVKEDNASFSKYAMMEDRYRTFEGLPQYYGTQLQGRTDDDKMYFCMIADIDNIDSRRRASGYSSIGEYAKKQGLDSVVIHPDFANYSGYYLHLSKAKRFFCMGDSAYLATTYTLDWNRFLYKFPKDVELRCLCELYLGDTLKAASFAKMMVLCGQRLEDKWHLPQFLIDSVMANYDELSIEYKRQLSKKSCTALDTLTSFESLVKVTEMCYCPRYCTEAWNTTVKKMIVNQSCLLGKKNYKMFFEWLYVQVIKGNFYLYDYAELYDEVYNRLYGRSYYGEKLFSDGLHVSRSEVKKISERRKAVNLPPFWVSCGLKGVDCPKGYEKETY